MSEDELGIGVLISFGTGVVLLVYTEVPLARAGVVLVVLSDFVVITVGVLVVGVGVLLVVIPCVIFFVGMGVLLIVVPCVIFLVGIGVLLMAIACVIFIVGDSVLFVVFCVIFIVGDSVLFVVFLCVIFIVGTSVLFAVVPCVMFIIGAGVVLVFGTGVVVVVITSVVLVVLTWVVLVVISGVKVQVAAKPEYVSILSVWNMTCIYPVLDVNTVRISPEPVSSTTFSTVEQENVLQRLILTKSYPLSVSKDENTRLIKPFEAIIQEQYNEFSYCDWFTVIIPDFVPVDDWHILRLASVLPTQEHVTSATNGYSHVTPSVLVCPDGHDKQGAGPMLVLFCPTGHDVQPKGLTMLY